VTPAGSYGRTDPTVVASQHRDTRRARRLNPAQLEELVSAYVAGDRVVDLAARYRIHRSTVITHLRRAGVPKYSGWDESVMAEARALYESGLPIAAISERLGRAKTTIGEHLIADGVEMRPRGFMAGD
jgi:hypothetical protein